MLDHMPMQSYSWYIIIEPLQIWTFSKFKNWKNGIVNIGVWNDHEFFQLWKLDDKQSEQIEDWTI